MVRHLPFLQTLINNKGLIVGIISGFIIGFLSLILAVPQFQQPKAPKNHFKTVKIKKKPMQTLPVSFTSLKNWQQDDHLAAFRAFQISCQKFIKERKVPVSKYSKKRLKICERAMRANITHKIGARQFFEQNFIPLRVITSRSKLTGYYEPELKGSRTKTAHYNVPLYRRPPDLVSLYSDKKRAAHNHKLSYMRRVGDKLVPFPTRRAIEQGALDGLGLELVYLSDKVDAFFMHVQGSARIKFEDGTTTRLGFDGKNGHPYSSIGMHMKEQYKLRPHQLGLDAVKSWLREDKDRGNKVMWHNKSFIFFRELEKEQSELGPLGAEGVSLTPRRSLAVDGSYHQLGLPIWLEVPTLNHHGSNGFRQLMIGQDVGSAIKGPARGDIFWGSGEAAGVVAGGTNHKGIFTVLMPR